MLFSCRQASEDKNVVAVQYPNESAPLALLMREMYEDMESIKMAIDNKEDIASYIEEHKSLLTAEPTKPEVQNQTYEHMGKAYLEQLELLENAEGEALLDGYKALVSNCLACHQQFCPGPIKRIEKLN